MSRLKVKGKEEYIEVQNVFCVGKNYVDHIAEFDTQEKKAEVPKEPVIFLKPNTAIVGNSSFISVPEINGKPISNNLQNEVELVLVIGKDGNNVKEEDAKDYIAGYAVGIDFTLRDIQAEDKKKGLPWTVAKGFKASAPVSEVVLKKDLKDAEVLDISLKVNDEIKQNGNTSQMIFKVNFIVHYISTIFGLRKNDIVFMGTPSGITKLNSGDRIEAVIQSIGKLNVTIK